MNKLQLEIGKIQHARKARRIERRLSKKRGISAVSVSASGVMQLEWDVDEVSQSEVLESVKNLGLNILHITSDQEYTYEDAAPTSSASSIFSLFGENTELYFAITSGVFWLLGLSLSFYAGIPENVSRILFIIGAVFGGVFTLGTAVRDLLQGKFEIDFLMLVAAIGAGALGKWGEGALLLFLFSLGHALEHYAMKRAKKSIAALSDLAPPVALLKRDGELIEVHIEELKIGSYWTSSSRP